MPNSQIGDTEKAPYSLTETDADSNLATPIPGDVILITSSDTDMATIIPDATPAPGTVASGFVVGGAKIGTVTINISVTHPDGRVLTAVDLIDIVGGEATTLSFGLGTPVPQNPPAPPPPPIPAAKSKN